MFPYARQESVSGRSHQRKSCGIPVGFAGDLGGGFLIPTEMLGDHCHRKVTVARH